MDPNTLVLAPFGDQPPLRNSGHCRACGAPIIWSRLVNNRVAMFDSDPVVIETLSDKSEVVSADTLHFPKCPKRKGAPVAP